MKWYHIAIIVACIASGVVAGVIASHVFHVTIWIAPVFAVVNGVSVYLALKRRIGA